VARDRRAEAPGPEADVEGDGSAAAQPAQGQAG